MAEVITNISKIKDQLVVGLRSGTNLVITLEYPYLIDKFPFMSIVREKSN